MLDLKDPLEDWMSNPNLPLIGLDGSWLGERRIHILAGFLSQTDPGHSASSDCVFRAELAVLDHADGRFSALVVSGRRATTHRTGGADWFGWTTEIMRMVAPEVNVARYDGWRSESVDIGGTSYEGYSFRAPASMLRVIELPDIRCRALVEGPALQEDLQLSQLRDATSYELCSHPSLGGRLGTPQHLTQRWPRLRGSHNPPGAGLNRD
jgi:hypothetical protein